MCIAVIPARYASRRFPGKPLALLGGKTVIERVYRQARSVMERVVVATDDKRIYNHVESFGGRVVMTRADHKSGTDRIEEAVEILGDVADEEVVLNIQGDEPFVHPSQIEALLSLFDNPQTEIGTLGKRFSSWEEVENPNSPKIVVSSSGRALYFSRSVIPYVRGVERGVNWLSHYPYLKHLGLYGYRRSVLRSVTCLPESALEHAECLEQLRWLEAGFSVKVALTEVETVGIDTPEDLRRAESFLSTISN